jgi:hypothetical protein
LTSTVSESFLVKEVDTESQNLSVIAAAGLEALHLVKHGGRKDQSWKNQQLAVVQQAQKIKRSVITDACEPIHKISGGSERRAELGGALSTTITVL